MGDHWGLGIYEGEDPCKVKVVFWGKTIIKFMIKVPKNLSHGLRTVGSEYHQLK